MKQIVIISGKGGTGKTVLTASFAALAKNASFADCDVDAADLHLLLKPEIKERHEFRSGKTAVIDEKKCIACKKCMEVCRFGAIYSPQKENHGQSTIEDGLRIDSISCEGCAVCSYICPVNAISMEENLSGEWYISETKYGPMVHAKLGIAEENSGKLVTLVRENAKKVGEEENKDYIIIDGPPGIGCPVIASLANVDLALIVTEPTLSGIHDMKRVVDVSRHFGIHTKVVINKCDINLKNTRNIREICEKQNLEILAELPFSEDVAMSVVKGMPVVEFCNGGIAKDIAILWERIEQQLKKL
ncbi:MAG: (4Fe-4S)-binding protein [Candidatus Omnitrophica bacterium 4484_70.1]|nr:MAG: (4Fe-4S)-binding protein [Candidatus Omnitrophica bacterium 4484_70.1]